MNRDDAFKFLCTTAEGIALMFGEQCETLVQEMQGEDMAVLAIYNGHVSGRSVGSKQGILGGMLSISDKRTEDMEALNQIVYHPSGKKIKSSSFLFKGDGYAYILGINYDITLFERMQQAMSGFISCSGELYTTMKNSNVGLLEDIYNSCMAMIPEFSGKIGKEKRQLLIKLLNDRKFFELQKSVSYLAEQLGVSKYTIYKDLGELQQL